jgi:outer membrane protein TolC
MALNRILDRPLEESFATEDASLQTEGLLTVDPGFMQQFASRGRFRALRELLVAKGIADSPEIQRLDAAIAAQDRWQRSRRRAFFSPTVALHGEVGRELASGGAGSDFAPPEPLAGLLEPADETEWSISLSLSLPLTTGGGRRADLRQSSSELAALRLEREAAAERIEQRIRSALHVAGASFAGIALARESAEAARANLDLVTDAYSRGVLQVIDLLDAQTASLGAELGAATAVYDFLLDLMEVERAIGRFAFFASPDERAAWLEEVERYQQNVVQPQETPEETR